MEEFTFLITRKFENKSYKKITILLIWISRIAKDTGINQMKLLVARNQRRCQKICSRMYKMSTKQSPTYKESGRTTSTWNTTRTIARDQYRYYGTTTKIEWKKYYCSYCWQVHKNDLIESNNDEYIFKRNHKDI